MQRSMAAWWAGLLLITAIGGAVRFTGLGFRDFWFDESCSYIYVRDLFDWQGERSLLVESTNLPYYLALRGWASVFGSSEVAYRGLSALSATLTVPLLGLIGRRLGGGRAGIAVACLAALHPLHIHYAHEARAYALWLLLLTLTLYALLTAVERADRRWWAAYATALLASLFTHYYTLLWVPASAMTLALSRDRVGAFRRWVVATGVALLVFCPHLLFAVLPAARGGGSAWVASSWSPGTALFETIWAFLPAGAYPAHLRGLSLDSPDTVAVGPAWIARASEVIPAAMVIGCGLSMWVQRRRAEPCGGGTTDPLRVLAATGALAAIPLMLAWAYSLLIRPIYLPGRYDLVAWPAFVVLIGLLLAQVSSDGTGVVVAANPGTAEPIEGASSRRDNTHGWISWAGPQVRLALLLSPLLLCAAVPIARQFALRPPLTIHHARANRLAELCGAGDRVIALSYDRAAMLYYLDRAGFRGEIISFPSWLDDQIGWLDTQADLVPDRVAAMRHEARALCSEIETRLDHGQRVLLLQDSMTIMAGANPREAITEILLHTLHESSLEVSLIDERHVIAEVRRGR